MEHPPLDDHPEPRIDGSNTVQQALDENDTLGIRIAKRDRFQCFFACSLHALAQRPAVLNKQPLHQKSGEPHESTASVVIGSRVVEGSILEQFEIQLVDQ